LTPPLILSTVKYMLGITDDYSRLELAMEAGGMAWWEMELPSGVVFFSENKTKMIGRNAADFTHYTDFTNLVHKDDHQNAMQAMTDHLTGKKNIYETSYRIACKDGGYRKFYDKGRIVSKDPDGTIKLTGIVIDVTDMKVA
jgi:PAS domain S-box-containing protein